ncbi:hypothetical protein SDRG_05007 [Saprolegnia diclina VS20]|uniref:Uncharacterized protein n=1 Tax=Saprolegnia diclina (strain VS20) TaxID=1156394 RepID=T0RXM0_SAPDV|nr:hypothetical protein SDRG_05007 [Saprolegnia diclina VS20]EQC37403.1 hypothetical protein SDRG_05007 [Saprolegnia diclina VS20]|eukprot:XP_008608923.1 hypothetical protein SDRG_05007 [Saprolegnia diclina VS20]
MRAVSGGAILAANGFKREAIDANTRVLAMDPKCTPAITATHDLATATTTMRVAQASFPELGQLRTAIVHAHAQGRLQEAVALNCIALLLSPQDGTTHTNAGAFYYEAVDERMGQVDAALQTYASAVALAPEYALGLYNYGTAVLKRRAWHDVVSLFWQRLGFRNHVAQVPSMLGIQALVHVLLLDTMPTPVADCTQRLLCEKYGVHFAPNSTLGALADATAACERSMNVTAIAVGHDDSSVVWLLANADVDFDASVAILQRTTAHGG